MIEVERVWVIDTEQRELDKHGKVQDKIIYDVPKNWKFKNTKELEKYRIRFYKFFKVPKNEVTGRYKLIICFQYVEKDF